jgi:rhodanese-related sulfurtransferase
MKLPWWLPIGNAPEITPQELKRWLDSGRPLHIADARTAAEFRLGSLPGAQHAPLTGMPTSLAGLHLNNDRPVVMLCLSGHRSLPGARWLRRRGYEAYSLKGGLLAWQRLGFDLSRPE